MASVRACGSTQTGTTAPDSGESALRYDKASPSLSEVKSGAATFELGQHGQNIHDLQKILIADGFDVGSQDPTKTDGLCGPKTMEAIDAYKLKNGRAPWEPKPAEPDRYERSGQSATPPESAPPSDEGHKAVGAQIEAKPSEAGKAAERSAAPAKKEESFFYWAGGEHYQKAWDSAKGLYEERKEYYKGAYQGVKDAWNSLW